MAKRKYIIDKNFKTHNKKGEEVLYKKGDSVRLSHDTANNWKKNNLIK